MDELYIHFDPNTKEYKAMGTLLGAATFTEIGGKSFMRERLDYMIGIWLL